MEELTAHRQQVQQLLHRNIRYNLHLAWLWQACWDILVGFVKHWCELKAASFQLLYSEVHGSHTSLFQSRQPTAPAVSKAKQSVPFSVLFCPSHANVEWCPAGRYQHYLESVLEGADEFHEIGDLILRHATLAATNQDLKEQRNHFGEAAEQTRSKSLRLTLWCCVCV